VTDKDTSNQKLQKTTSQQLLKNKAFYYN